MSAPPVPYTPMLLLTTSTVKVDGWAASRTLGPHDHVADLVIESRPPAPARKGGAAVTFFHGQPQLITEQPTPKLKQ
jgi:hypothetical protein